MSTYGIRPHRYENDEHREVVLPSSCAGLELALLERPGIDQVHVADDPERHPGLVAVAYLGETSEAVVESWLRAELGTWGQGFTVRCYGSLPGGTI